MNQDKPSHFQFTKSAIDAIKPPKTGRRSYFDQRQRGLSLRVSATGKKVFCLYKQVNGKEYRKDVGEFPYTSVEEARLRVGRILHDIIEDPERSKAAYSRTVTFGEAFERYVSDHLTIKSKEKDIKATRGAFNLYLSEWQDRSLRDIDHEHVQKLVVSLKDKPYRANRLVQLIRAVYNKMIAWKLFTGSNPASGITRYNETPRARFLSKAELARLFAAMETGANKDLRDFLLLATLTGARKESLLAMSWNEIDFEEQTWRCPAERQKNGSAKVFALTRQEIEILQSRAQSGSKWVFPSSGAKSGRVSATGHIVNLEKQWKRLRRDADLNDVHIHDLRRTLASWMVRAGVDLRVIQSTLNHKDIGTTAAVYAQTVADHERSAKEAAHSMMAPSMVKSRKKQR